MIGGSSEVRHTPSKTMEMDVGNYLKMPDRQRVLALLELG
jgi:hypothetical protein